MHAIAFLAIFNGDLFTQSMLDGMVSCVVRNARGKTL
jgi:hypothetical protein